MKVVALGVKKGHRLRFCRWGAADAEPQALKAISDAIAAGLGEAHNEQTMLLLSP